MADIPINEVTRRVQFTGNTTVGPFAFTFNILDDDDLVVYKNNVLQTITTHYTVSTNANGTGSITMTSALVASDVLTIIGGRALERTTDFVTAGDLLASSLNEQLDSLVIMAQQLDEKLDRALKVDIGDQFTDLSLPAKADRLGTVLAFNATSGDPEVGPTIGDVSSIAAITADISTLADIEDGTDATDAIQTVAGISSNVSTVAGVSANVTTVAGISSDVTAVAGDATDIGTVATNIASVNTVATNIADVITVANDLNEAVSEVVTVADDLNEAVSEIDTVAASISNVDAVGTNISNVNTVAGISANVTTVAGVSANVTTVAGISSNVTTVAGVSSDVTTVAGISANVTTVAGDTTNIGTIATDLSGSDNIGTVAGSISNVNSVGGSIANVNTVAANITGVNSFAERYRVGSSDPTTSLDEGDLFFNTTSNSYKFYDGSSWQTVNVAGIGSLADDSSPQLGGNLDVNGNEITSASNGNVVLNPNGTGQIQLNSTVVVQDGTHDFDVASHDGTNGLKLGGVLVTATAAELNYVDGVTSAIQTQIDAKADIDDPTFTTGITSPQIDITAQGDLRLQDSAGGQYIGLQAPATISSSFTLTLPTSDGSADQVLTTNGSGTLSFADAGGGGGLQSIQVFTSSGTWTKPSGITKIIVRGTGGGGSGGGPRPSTTSSSGGGGAAGYFEKFIDVSSISSETVTIGSGGAAQSSSGSTGNSGGTTSFGSHASANGGSGGYANVSGGTGGAGGSTTGGDISISGANGGDAEGDTRDIPGYGGASPFGGHGSAKGYAATGYGSGGGGSFGSGSSGAGKSGIIIVEEYA